MNFLIMINPHGGRKLGPSLFNKVKPYFDSKNMVIDVIETCYAGHAQDIANQIDLNKYDGLLAIGGDGTLNEVINGMLTRNDQKKITIGIIPGGSGNSFMHDLKLTDPIKAAKAIINNKITSLDVASIKLNHIKKYSINMIGWGMVTEVGEKAEKYRWLGPSRYTIFSALEVIRKKNRKATLIINDKIIENNFTFIIACNSIHVGKGMQMAPKAKLNDGLIDLIVVKGNVTRNRLLKVLPKLFKGTHLNEPEVEYFQTNHFSLITKNKEALNIDGEILGTTPIEVKILPRAFDMFCQL